MKAFLLVLVGLAAVPSRAEAEMTGTQFYESCVDKPQDGARNICEAYLSGYQVGFFVAQTLSQAGIPTCLPEGMSGTQTRLIVEKYMRDHPEELHKKVELIVMDALRAAYPCAPPR
jgi:hypothetical protein